MANLRAIFNELCMSFNEQKINATTANFYALLKHDHYENPELFAYLLILGVSALENWIFTKAVVCHHFFPFFQILQ